MLLDFLTYRRPNDGDVLFLHPTWKPFFAFRLLIYAAAVLALVGLYLARRPWKPMALAPALFLGVPFLFDMGSFRAQVFLTMPTLAAEELLPGVFEVAPLPYQPYRRQQPPAGLGLRRIQVLTQSVALAPTGTTRSSMDFPDGIPMCPLTRPISSLRVFST